MKSVHLGSFHSPGLLMTEWFPCFIYSYVFYAFWEIGWMYMLRSKRVVAGFEVSWASKEEERNREDLEN